LKKGIFFFAKIKGGLGFLNFSRKIYCKNYNEVLIHLGVIWRKGRAVLKDGKKVGFD